MQSPAKPGNRSSSSQPVLWLPLQSQLLRSYYGSRSRHHCCQRYGVAVVKNVPIRLMVGPRCDGAGGLRLLFTTMLSLFFRHLHN